MDLYLLSVIAFAVIIGVIALRDRKNFEIKSLLVFRKTKKGKRFIKKIVRKSPRFWKIFGTVAVFVGFSASIYSVYSLVTSTQVLATRRVKLPWGGGVLLPSPFSKPTFGPGFLAIPFWHFIIVILVLMGVHELSHGIMAVRERIKIKSIGWLCFLLFPALQGAFVEPDEKQLIKKSRWAQLRVFAAGSFANLLVAGLVYLIYLYMIESIFIPAGVGYQYLINGYPAAEVNLTGIIVRINNYTINTIEDLNRTLCIIGPNKTIKIITTNYTTNRTFYLTTAVNPKSNISGCGFIGIGNVVTHTKIKPNLEVYSSELNFMFGLTFWMWFINLMVGLFNMLPIWFFDGYRMWELLFQKITKKYYKFALDCFGAFVLALIIADMLLIYVLPNLPL